MGAEIDAIDATDHVETVLEELKPRMDGQDYYTMLVDISEKIERMIEDDSYHAG